tara:strand:- start:3373 stop:3642 length:270 start_codon:yes stop_codon:yes gene_type:complete
MKDILFLSVAISLVFFFVRAGELKLVKKQELDIKTLSMDSLYVFISSGFAQLVMGQMGDMEGLTSFLGDTGISSSLPSVPGVFTDAPEF